MFYQTLSKFSLLRFKALADTVNNILKLSKINALLLLLKILAYREKLRSKYTSPSIILLCIIIFLQHLKNTLKDFLFKIGMRGNPLTVKGLSFQRLSFYCQSISFGLEMKSFIVRKKFNFEHKRKKIVWYNLIRSVHNIQIFLNHFSRLCP